MSSFMASPKIRLARNKSKSSNKKDSKDMMRERSFGSYSKNSSIVSVFSGRSNAEVYTGTRKQQHGFLWRKPFRKNALNQGSWKKSYFILYESFLVWYLRPPKTLFDINPAGCLPLGGCQVFPLGKLSGGYGFEITSTAFPPGHSLVLKCRELASTQMWIDQMITCQSATYENSTQGDRAINELNEKMKEDLNLRQLQKEAKRQADTVNQIKEDNVSTMEKHLDDIEANERQLSMILKQNEKLQSSVRKREKSAARKVKRISAVATRTEIAKQELKRLKSSFKTLEACADRVPFSQRKAFEEDLDKLKSLLDSVLKHRDDDLSWDEF